MIDLTKALEILKNEDVVGMPTETVYGLAARIDSEKGLRKIFEVKERPFFDPLIVHVASIEQAKSCASEWSPITQALTEKYWPGPLTLVVPKSDRISSLITSGLETVGLRCPRHPLALQLIEQAAVPLAAPSANRFGRTSPTSAQHVRDEFQGRVHVLDGGLCDVGIESTIVAVQGETLLLLRPGILSREEISEFLKNQDVTFKWGTPVSKTQAPGQMKHHYMPAKPLVVFGQTKPLDQMLMTIEKHLGVMPDEVEGVRLVKPSKVHNLIQMHLSNDPVLAARELYQRLREASEHPGEAIVLVWPAHQREQVWAAVWDRLRKAASLQFD